MAADHDPTEEQRTHATPAGGVSSVCYYRDGAGNPAPKSKATAAEIIEFDAAGNSIARTYLTMTTT